MSRYDSDSLRSVSAYLRTGRGVPRTGPFQVGAYAASPARPRRCDSLAAEQAETRPQIRASASARWRCTGVPAAGGARSGGGRDGELSSDLARRLLPGHYFRIRRDATISIARLTVSDSNRRINRASWYRNFAPGGRRVTAGDGNMVPVGHMGHPPTGSPRSTRQSRNAGRNTGPGGEATHNVRTYTRGRAAVDAGGGRHDVSCRPQNRHTVGEGRKTDLNPHAGGTPALPGD
jgi:hypothetical protein